MISYADLTSPSEPLFVSFSDRTFVQNVSNDIDLIFTGIHIQVSYI